MKIFVLNLRKTLKFTAIAAAAILIICLAGMFRGGIVSVFSVEKELPIYYVDRSEKAVAITFDCAWEADDIPDILKALDAEGAKATFFIVGDWAKRFPDKVKMIYEHGHDVANHSDTHLRMGSIEDSRIKDEILNCTKKLEDITGAKTDLFRAPFGDYNNNVIKIARDLGYYTIQWDVDSLDWKPGISQQEIISRINDKVKNGSIILFHNDTPHTAKLLPQILKSLKKDGYGFLPVSKMIIRDNYNIEYDGKQTQKQKPAKEIT